MAPPMTTKTVRITPPIYHLVSIRLITIQGKPFDRNQFESVLKRRLFFTPAFEIYGGVAGLYDYGPPLCSLQAAFVDAWRKHFVIEEGILEVEPTILTPRSVLLSSGHVDRFVGPQRRNLQSRSLTR